MQEIDKKHKKFKNALIDFISFNSLEEKEIIDKYFAYTIGSTIINVYIEKNGPERYNLFRKIIVNMFKV